MTDSENVPAVRVSPARVPERPSTEVAALDVDGWVAVARPIFELAARVYDTDFVPRGLRGSEPATAAAMLYGRELNLPPMTSLASIHVIDGKPGLSAEQMRAMVYAAGHEIEFTESTGALCTVRGRRRGQERWTTVTWTIDMARAAGLGGKHIWKSYPRTQLQARCTTELARLIFPDVIHGFRSVEELEDMGEANGTEAAPGGAASGTSKVSRRRTTRKRAEPAPRPSDDGNGAVEVVGPPLPGEPGYEDDSPPVHAEAAPAAAEASGTVHGRGVPDAGEGETTGNRDPAGEDSPSPAPEVAAGSHTDDDGREGSRFESGASSESGGDGEATPNVAASDPEPPGAPVTAQHDDDVPTHPVGPRKPSRAQMRMLWGTLGGFGLTTDEEREERLLVATTILGREVETMSLDENGEALDLSADECKTLIDALAMVTPPNDRAALNRLLDQYDADKLAIAEQNEEDGKP